MKLIGQFDSPFVRRVGIALRLYGMPFEHVPWSVWRDAEQIATVNPLRRVPTLVLDDGEALVESSAILEFLDEERTTRQPGEARGLLMPARGPARRLGLRICALATGVADKAVSLFYEPLLREHPAKAWMQRCQAQIRDALALLNAERARIKAPYWLGRELSHADIAMACTWRFTTEAHPDLIHAGSYPALEQLATTCENMSAFREIAQPLHVTFR